MKFQLHLQMSAYGKLSQTILNYARVRDIGRGKAGLNRQEYGSGVGDSCQSFPRAPPKLCFENII